MRNSKTKFKGRIIAFIIISSLFIFFNPLQNDMSVVQAASGTYTEDFTTTTNMDGANTNTTGWGTGTLDLTRKSPKIIGSYGISIDFMSDVYVEGYFAYLACIDDGLIILNISKPESPSFYGSYADISFKPYSVTAQDGYCYIGDASFGFHVINVSNPSAPTHQETFITEGIVNDVCIENEYVYFVDKDEQSNEGIFNVVDISDPTNPNIIGTHRRTGFMYDITISEDYAFIATDVGLLVLDVSDPTDPLFVDDYSIAGIGQGVDINDDFAYLAELITNPLGGSLRIINIADPTDLTEVGIYDLSPGTALDVVFNDNFTFITDYLGKLHVVYVNDTTLPVFAGETTVSGEPQKIFIKENVAFVASGSSGLQIFRIISSKYVSVSPILVGSYFYSRPLYSIHVIQNLAYLLCDWGLRIVDISDPSNPVYVGAYETGDLTDSLEVFVSGDYAYVANSGNGLYIINVSIPAIPTFAGIYVPSSGEAHGVYVENNFAYVANLNGFLIVNVTDPSSPTLAGSCSTSGGGAQDVYVAKGYAYVASDSIHVINIDDPTNPYIIGSYEEEPHSVSVFIDGMYLYSSKEEFGIDVFSLIDPTSPVLTGSYDTPDIAWNTFVNHDCAYVADGLTGLLMLNVSDPSSPTYVDTYGYFGIRVDDVFVLGDYAYLAGNYGLEIVKVREKRDVGLQYDSPSTAQSSIVFSSSSISIKNAIFNVDDSVPINTSISYYLSADNGIHWEQVTPGIEHEFTNIGNQMKWRVILSTNDSSITPTISFLSIDFEVILDSPSLVSPLDGTISEDYTPTFTWSGINGETNYLFQLDTTTSFITPLLNLTLPSSSTSYTPSSPLADDTYYWRVAGIDSEGDIGTFSSYRTIFLIEDTNVPLIDHPNDVIYEEGTIGNSITWNPSDTNPYYYNITRNTTILEHGIIWDGESITIDIDGLAEGVYNFTCFVYDRKDLFAWDSVFVTVEIPVIGEFTFQPVVTIMVVAATVVVINSKKKRRTHK